MDAITALARDHGLTVIEDAAQGMGARYRGRHAGGFGAAAAFSAHPLKGLSALGDAGFMATNDADVARRVSLHRTHGLESRDTCVEYGVSSRLDALQAAVLELRLTQLTDLVERRRENVRLYRELIREGPIRLPQERPHEHVAWTFLNDEVARRDELRTHLSEQGIETLLYYGTALHLHPAAAGLGYKRGDFPVAERQCDQLLALPHHQHLSQDQIAYVADTINGFYGS